MSDTALTLDKIDEIEKCLRCKRSRVIELYKNFIPVGSFSSWEKFAFAVCSIKSAGELPARIVASQLAIGPCGYASIDRNISRCSLIRNWRNAYPEHFESIVEYYAPFKLVPEEIKSNKEWVCLCAFNEALLWAVFNGEWPDGVITVDNLDKLLSDWRASNAL